MTAPWPPCCPQPWGGSAGRPRDPPRLSPAVAHFGAGSPPCPYLPPLPSPRSPGLQSHGGGPAHPDTATWERSPRGGAGLGKSCGLQGLMGLGCGKGHVQGLGQDMEGQKAPTNGPKCPWDHWGVPALPEVSATGPGAEESPIAAVTWVGVASPMGAAQPPTSAPAPAALSISPGPGWDWTYFMGDRTRSLAGALRLLGRLGHGLGQLQDFSHHPHPACLPGKSSDKPVSARRGSQS